EIALDLEKEPEEIVGKVKKLKEKVVDKAAEAEIALDLEKEPEEIVGKVKKPKKKIADEVKEKVVDKPAEAEVALDLEKEPEETVGKAKKPKGKVVDKSAEAEVALDLEKEPEETVGKVKKPKEKIADEVKEKVVDKPAEAEVALDLEKEPEETVGKVKKPKEKIADEVKEKVVDKLIETEVVLDLEKQLEHEIIDVSIVNVILESVQYSIRLAKEAKTEQPSEEVVEKTKRPKKKVSEEIKEEAVDKLIEAEVPSDLEKQLEESVGKAKKPKEKIADELKEKVVDKSAEAEVALDLEKEPEETVGKAKKPKGKVVDKSAEAEVALDLEKEPEEIVGKVKKPKKKIADEVKEKVVDKPAEAEVALDLEKQLEEAVGKAKKPKEKVVDKSAEAEVALDLEKEPEEIVGKVKKPKKKIVDKSAEAEIALDLEKEPEEIVGKVEKLKEKVVDKAAEAEIALDLEKEPEEIVGKVRKPKKKIGDEVKEKVVDKSTEGEVTLDLEKQPEETVGKARKPIENSAVESWCKVIKSEREVEFNIHLSGVKASLTKETRVSLCVEKSPEHCFADTITTSAGFCYCSLFVVLPGLPNAIKEGMERPTDLSVMKTKHAQEIPVETVSISFELTKQRTQKIGVGTIFNSERPTEQIELVEEIIRASPYDETVQILMLSEKCSSFMSLCIGGKTENEDVDVDINRTVFDIPGRRSKERSKSVVADIEVDAGEEMATTDAIVDVLTSFEETELIINELASDFLDVGVTLDALMEDESIEVIGPVFHSQTASLVVQMSTAVAAVSRLIEEVKMLVANAETEILLSATSETEMQQLNLKLQKTERKSLKNSEIDHKREDAGKESQDIDKGNKEKPKEGIEKKKKKIPKALVIPAEISSKYGDKSTLLSETIMIAEIVMNEETAEVKTSPKKPLSASLSLKVDSAKNRKSVSRRASSAENFTFKDIEKEAEIEVAKESMGETKKRTGLPPLPKTKKEMEVEFVFAQDEYQENTENIFPIKFNEELVIAIQAIAKSQKKKMEKAKKDLEEEKQEEKSIKELEETETIELARTVKDSEKEEAYERVRRKRVGFIQPPDKEIIAFRGDTIKIECELVNNDDCTWLINNKPVSEDSRCNEEVNSLIRTLTITNISPKDNETIIVAKVGDVVAETIIHVEDTPAEIIEPLPRRSFGKCGEDVVLAVSVTHPPYSIIWEFNGEKLSEDDKNYVIAGEGNTYTLTIKNATYDHAGRYSIKVDSLETSTMLIMQGAPIVEKQEPESVDFEVHENLLLSIRCKSVPEPTIACFFNNEPLLVGTKLKLEIINDVVQFCKRKTNKNDSGEYTFKISNEFGEAVKTFTVNVKDICDAPRNLRITDISRDTASIKWEAPKDSGGSKIIGYIIEKKEIGRRTFHHVIQVTGDKTNCLIEDLDADTEYNFRVAAVNKYGTGEFAEFPIAHTSAAPEESEEISEEEMQLRKTPENMDEEQELIESKKQKVKKAVKKDKSKKTEQLEEEMKQVASEERHENISDFKEDAVTAKDLEQHDVSELEIEKVEETLTRVKSPEEKVKDEVLAMDKEKVGKSDIVEDEEQKPKKTKRKKTKKEEKPSEEIIPTTEQKSVEAAESFVEDNVNKAVEVGKETIEDYAGHIEQEVKDKVLAMDKEKVGKSDIVEDGEQKPKKTKRMKTKKEEKPSEEIIPTAQQKSVEATESFVEDNVNKAVEVGKETIEDYAGHVEQKIGDKIPLKKEKAVTGEMKYVNELDRKKSEGKRSYAEETVALSTEGKKFENRLGKKVLQGGKKSAETAVEFEVEENFEIKHGKEKEVDVDEVSETVKLGKITEGVALEEESIIEGNQEIKKKRSKEVIAAKKAAVDVANERRSVQLEKQDIIAEEITTSKIMKIEAEKAIKKDDKEGSKKDKSKVKKKEQRAEQREKTDEIVSADVFFKNISNIENVCKVISTLGNKEIISTTVKATSKTKKSKTPKELIKEKPEDMLKTQEDKPEAEKLEAKLEVDEEVERPEKEKFQDDVLKRLDSGQEVEERKPVEDKEVKPKKVADKKVVKKALKKPKVENEMAKKSVEEDVKQNEDEIRDVHVEEKYVKEEKVNGFKDEVEKLDSISDVDVTVNIPASEILELEDSTRIITPSHKDEIPTARRVRKRPSGFVLPPQRQILAFRNDTVKIECEVFNEEDKINWTINGKPATDDIRCTEVVDGYLRILQIKSVVPEDTDMVITASIHEHSAESRLIVEDIPVEIIEKLPRKITAKMDDSVKLSITVSHPDQNCQWFFNKEQLIENNDRYEVNVEGNICSLLIKNLAYNQTGRYSVKVDSAETSTILTVEGAPMLHEAETIITTVDLESQDNLVLMVPFKAVPEPTVECLLNNEKIPSSLKTQLDIFNDKVCFRKRKVDKNDAGEYTIKIRNDYGEVSQTFFVNIKDVPGPPKNGHITDIGSSCARVHWEAPNDDGGSAITGYIVEKREESRRAFHRVAQVSSEEMDYYIDDLKMNTSYTIRIAAMNNYGVGEYLECASFQTSLPFEAPTITHPPVVSNITDQSCTLKWERVTEDGGSPIYGYDMFVRKDKGDWVKVNDEMIFTEQFTVSNIETGPTYEFKVEATNEAGLTSKSDVISEPLVIIKAAELPILSLPTVELVSGDTVRVQWIDVMEESCNVTSYVIMYKSENASLWSEKEIERSPADINGLKEGLSYLFKVAPKSGPTIGEFSEETIPIRIVAAKKPEITKSIRDISVSRKRELKLECHATGEPTPQYIWYKDNQEIVPAAENIEIINEGSMSILLIHHTSTADGGLYRCEVVNDHGSAESEALVTVTEVRAHFVSSFPEYVEIDEGEEIGFSCELSDADASVVWLKDGKPLPSDDRIMIKEDGVERKLTIRNAVLEDSGKYVCSTIDKKTQSEAELIVKEELPHIKRGPQDQIVTEFNTTITLKCETTKSVKAVKWLKNKKEIWPRQEKYSMNVEGTVATLTIMHFELNDCAEYKVALREDEESAPAKVELKIPPMIKLSKVLPNNAVKLHCGTDFDIEFDYEGFPEVDINTTINEKPLNKMRSRIHTYNNKLSLRLKNVIQEDSGVLKVVVENEIGSASEEIQLYVISVPSKPLNLTAFNITSRSVMLKWEKAEDNGSPITNYIVERRTTDTKRWRNIGKCKSEQYEFLVEELYPSESYSFRIIAVNEVGEGAPSNVVDVVTMNERVELETTTKLLLAPNYLKGTLVEDGKIILITWEKVEEAEQYIIERSKLENYWEQIGVTVESKFEDSFDESSSNKYRVIAKKDDLLSSPSEEIEIVNGLDYKEKEIDQLENKTIEMSQEISDMNETKRQETVEQKSEKLDDQIKQEKVDKKVGKKKEGKEKGKVEVVEKLEDAEKQEINAEGKAETKAELENEQEEIKVGRKVEDEFKSPEKVVEDIEEKTGSKKVAKKGIQKKKKAKKEEIPKDEVEVTKNFEEEMIKAEEKSGMDFEGEREKDKIKSNEEKIKSMEKVKKAEVEETLKEKHLEKKLEGKPEKKVEVVQKTELSEAVKVEPDKDSEIKKSAEVKQEDGNLSKKKKTTSKQRPKETMEQKLEESISQDVISNDLIAEKKKEEETVMQTEKLEVKSVNNSVTVNYGMKSFELRVDISGNFDECFWTKDGKAIDDKLVKTTANNSVLRLENIDELAAGLYHCTATNKMEKATAEICVTVADKPKIEFDETVIGVKDGEMLKIHANVTGLPIPTCKWLKDGVELKTDNNTIITFKEGVAVLTIKKANVGNSGLYKLIAENIYGKQENQVELQVKGAPSAPVGPLQISDITNVSCKLAWYPPEQNGNSKLLGYCIEKRDAKKSSWAFVARTTSTNAVITGLTDSAKYYFRVTAENAFGTGSALENNEPVQPIKITATEKPKIKKAPEKEIGRAGDKLILSVEFTAEPVPEVHWYKNGKELFDDVSSTITKMDKKSVFTIQKLVEDDEGDYQVTVENEAGKAQHKISVEVKSEPMIIDADKYKEPQVFHKGENVKLQFAFTAELLRYCRRYRKKEESE
ncbi:unnamed protein product, partial [Cercopithifilaria johnstoni]